MSRRRRPEQDLEEIDWLLNWDSPDLRIVFETSNNFPTLSYPTLTSPSFTSCTIKPLSVSV